MSSADAIAGLEPAALWKRFAELSLIPRESKRERAAGDWVVRVARELGLEHHRDAAGNVLVRKPASAGREGAAPTCLQGHLDMVCVARPGSAHDFARDPIELVRAGDELRARETTLGADNGIAVAAMLAVAGDLSLEHGPLELLFTVDEETGLTGAHSVPADWLRSRRLVNLDTEEEDVLCVGCAGGRDTLATWPLATTVVPGSHAAMELRVTGLRGGHSGVEIGAGHGNALQMLARVIGALAPLRPRIARFEGGSKRNAIPAEARAVVSVRAADAEAAAARVAEMRDVLRGEYRRVETGLDVVVSPVRRPARAWSPAFQARVLRVIAGLPHGVVRMSPDIPGLVQTSTNVAVLTQSPRALTLMTSQRSMAGSEIAAIIATVTAILELGGATVSGSDGYPGWKPDLGSRVLATARTAHRAVHGADPKVEAVHAGLECGILGEKVPGLDMVSMGPTIQGAHSPDERVDVPSVGRWWRVLVELLRSLD
jgi:dipeptidase D